jgi:hypothetical protein
MQLCRDEIEKFLKRAEKGIGQEKVSNYLIQKLRANQELVKDEIFKWEMRRRMADREGPWISLYSGNRVYPLDIRPEDIFIEDIAHALSIENRFCGHYKFPVSVAYHSILVAAHTPKEFQLQSILHDGSEAYLKDIPTPLKRILNEYGNGIYEKLEGEFTKAIFTRFGVVPTEESDIIVHKADRATFAREIIDCSRLGAIPGFIVEEEPISTVVREVGVYEAKKEFLQKFELYQSYQRY